MTPSLPAPVATCFEAAAHFDSALVTTVFTRSSPGRRQAGLRYGWHDVVGHAGQIATQVEAVLLARGRGGRARPCRPGCPAGTR